jgi:hypothetical protein
MVDAATQNGHAAQGQDCFRHLVRLDTCVVPALWSPQSNHKRPRGRIRLRRSFCERWSKSFLLKAVGQHAQVAERHHEILRQQVHKLMSQTKFDGLLIAVEDLLADAILAKNSLLTIAGTTPYTAVLGSTPALLPD